MKILHTLWELRQALSDNPQPVLVPTMGNLHAGHIALIRQAKRYGRPVVVSIYVNPLQFGPTEDFGRYPRTLEQDCDMVGSAGCDVVFAPTDDEMYPEAQTVTVVPDPELAKILEGEFRPGFFTGVCTVVAKLLLAVQPQVAIFGKKDYQQLRVIEHMVRQLCIPVQITAGETVRAPDGLALSSRNGYLNPEQRARASQLYLMLEQLRSQILAGARNWEELASLGHAMLLDHGWQTDYVAIRERRTLGVPGDSPDLVILAAARLGGTRLIDNVEVSLP